MNKSVELPRVALGSYYVVHKRVMLYNAPFWLTGLRVCISLLVIWISPIGRMECVTEDADDSKKRGV